MARFRLLLLGLASGSVFYSGAASALGLGDINLHSALNQPLDAEIELLQVGDLEDQDIKVRLASDEEFRRIGVDRFYFLNDLRFTPVLRGGRGLIRVQSSKPVREPYLNFIVEVARPGGNLLREYTVLIDPPGSSFHTPQAAPLPAPVANTWQRGPDRPLPPAVNGERYQVQRGDSLWTIAGRLQGNESAGSREALMGDILALNPQAFTNGDPGRLLAGAQLLLPDSVRAPVAEPVSAAVAADSQVAPQAPAVAAEEQPPAQVEQERLVAELAQVNAQNLQLQNTLSQLQEQLQQLQTQMAEKDLQMQQIRAQLEQQAMPVAPPAPVVTEAAAPVTESRSMAWVGWLVAALVLLLLAGFALLAWRRRAPSEPLPQRQPPAEPRMVSRSVVREAEQREPVAVPVTVAPPAPQPKAQPATDPLEGANIYIAYGRFADAANSLRRAIEQHPERLDLRLRMLEVCGELGDAGAFFEQERQLQEMGASHVQIDQIRARYGHLQRTQETAAAVAAREPVEQVTMLQDDFQLNLDDLSLDADWELASPFQPEQSARSKAEKARQDLLDPDFSSNLQELPEVSEMSADDGLLATFAEMPQEQVLDADFIDAFDVEQVERREGGSMSADLDHLAGNRDHLVRLNTALAYIEQGDIGSACDILNELISQGDEQEREQARELLAKIA